MHLETLKPRCDDDSVEACASAGQPQVEAFGDPPLQARKGGLVELKAQWRGANVKGFL